MRTFAGTVENGSVRLPAGAHVRDGTEVVVTILPHARRRGTVAEHAPELEAGNGRLMEKLSARARELRRRARLGELVPEEATELAELHELLDRPTAEDVAQLRAEEEQDHCRFQELLCEFDQVMSGLRSKANGPE
ncbi:MAG: hypothetical protein FJ291_04610 [Planctomycetes bacterium]|nr:hypothetical protein [Planctomycetota bacterium]